MLTRCLLLLAALAGPLVAFAQDSAKSFCWFDARGLTVEGKGWTNTQAFFDRYPAKAEQSVRPAVWELSRDSAGMAVRFITDAPAISARWTLRKETLAMAHMPATGVSGLDLYIKDQGRWQFAGRAPARALTNEFSLLHNRQPLKREFLLYLPLYNGVKALELGIPASSHLEAAPVRPQKPIVFYGTSILQGGCASRPGMAYPAIIGRHLDWPTLNLGFSGNAVSEPEVAQLLAELEPAVYVLDALPNMTTAAVTERIEPFVQTLRQAHPKTPIVLVEEEIYTNAKFVQFQQERSVRNNTALKAAYARLRTAGVKNLYYIPADNLLGNDGEATVDGVHPTDLGFLRMADTIGPVLRRVLHKHAS
jgi:lysophospholipase L1-like esterase